MIPFVSINSMSEIEKQGDKEWKNVPEFNEKGLVVDEKGYLSTYKSLLCKRILSENEFTKEELVVKTPYADMYKGTYKEKPVAIKNMLLTNLISDLESEFDPYWKVVDNKCLIHLHGICVAPSKFAMVMELMECDLHKYLTGSEIIPKGEPVPIEQLLFIELRIGQGLDYLHNVLKIAHRALRDTNVLLNLEPMTVKIADFSLFKIRQQIGDMRLGRGGTSRWNAPSLSGPQYRQKRDTVEFQQYSDIYSYGVLAWQMRSREIPFKDDSEAEVARLLSCGTHPDVKSLPNCSEKEKKLMTDCFFYEPSLRPTAKKIVQDKTEKAIFVTWLKNTPGNVFSNGQMIDISSLIAKFAFLTTYK